MTEKITREEIEALLKLAVAATPGPWKQHLVDDTTVICSQREICCTFAKGGLNDDLDFNSDTEQFEVDAAFIAAANPVVLKALCTLALQALDMEPRPIEEAPKDGKFIGFLEDGRACTMSWRQHVKTWKPIEGGGHVPDGYHWLTCEEDHDSRTPRKAIAWIPFPPLTSLLEPRR